MRSPKLIAAALGLVAVATAAAPGWGSYVVHSGDTLWGLAHSHHTTVAALERENHLHGDVIYVGQRLEIPGLGAGKPAASVPTHETVAGGSATYVVRPGDTLTAVADRFHTSLSTLARINHLSGRMIIVIGQHLRVPVPTHTVVTPTHSTAAASSGAAQVANAADPGPTAIRAMVGAEARRQGVSPALAEAIATQESGFHMRIVSPTGAVGVMQLEPSTAAWLSGFGLGSINPYDLTQNIRGGVLLLHILGEDTGNQHDQIAAYYEGLGAVRAGHLYDGTAQYVRDVQALEKRYS